MQMFSAGGGTFKLADFGHALHVGDTAAPAHLQGDLCAPSDVHPRRMGTHKHNNMSAVPVLTAACACARAQPSHMLCL